MTALISKEGKVYTFTDYYQNASAFAKSAIKIGLKPKDGVGIIGFNSPEYHMALHGTWLANGVTVGIYTTNNEEACKYVLEHSESVICVCQSGKQFTKILSLRDHLPLLKAIVVYWHEEDLPVIEDDGFAKIYKWEDFIELGKDLPDSAVDERIASTLPGSCATLIYTSGTTGNPKGVMCSHDSCTYNSYIIKDTVNLTSYPERIVGFLPLNHVAAQYVDVMITTFHPVTVQFAQPDALKGSLVNSLKKTRPTMFVAVPRVYEKMMENITAVGKKNSSFMKWISARCREIGYSTCMTRQYGCTFRKSWGYALAKKLVFDTVRSALGFTETRMLLVSAAPVTEETLRFFASFDMPIYDLLGQSEGTAPISTCTAVNQTWKIGTVGRPLPGIEIKVDPQNQEIMYKGRNTMMGYLKLPHDTLHALDTDGWIHTGDQGIKDEDGFLKVTGRLKELIVTAGGENISPVIIENKIMELSPIMSCCVAIGDKRKFISLLVCIRCKTDEEGESTHVLARDVVSFLESLGSTAKTIEEAMKDEKVAAHINSVVAGYNKVAVSRAQEIRKWCIIPEEFTIGRGELTATMKLRRAVVQEHYSKEIDAMYNC